MLALILGYLLASYRYGIVKLRADVDDLRPFFAGTEADYADVVRSITHQPRLQLRVVGVFGLLLAIAIPEAFMGRFTRLFVSGDWNLFDLWMTVYVARLLVGPPTPLRGYVVFHMIMLQPGGIHTGSR